MAIGKTFYLNHLLVTMSPENSHTKDGKIHGSGVFTTDQSGTDELES